MLRLTLISAAIVVSTAEYPLKPPPRPVTEPPQRYLQPKPAPAQPQPKKYVEEHHHHHSGDPLQWLRDALPGEPGQDYPIYATVPDTGFSCQDKIPGYYADVSAGCQPFHVCSPVAEGEWAQLSFLCPNGTIFEQAHFTCKWWWQVDCSGSEQFYAFNEEIGLVGSTLQRGPSFTASQSRGYPGQPSRSSAPQTHSFATAGMHYRQS